MGKMIGKALKKAASIKAIKKIADKKKLPIQIAKEMAEEKKLPIQQVANETLKNKNAANNQMAAATETNVEDISNETLKNKKNKKKISTDQSGAGSTLLG